MNKIRKNYCGSNEHNVSRRQFLGTAASGIAGSSLLAQNALSAELKKQGNQALKLTTKIEKQYADEDEAMMIRLIKARDSLWT